MALTYEEFRKYKVTQRPYPKDIERLFNVKKAMVKFKIASVSELAVKLKINYTVLTEIINGTRRSPVNEKRIAAFFKMPVSELFPPRTQDEIAEMNKKEQERNKGAA